MGTFFFVGLRRERAKKQTLKISTKTIQRCKKYFSIILGLFKKYWEFSEGKKNKTTQSVTLRLRGKVKHNSLHVSSESLQNSRVTSLDSREQCRKIVSEILKIIRKIMHFASRKRTRIKCVDNSAP